MELRYACPQCGTESRLTAAEDSSVLTCPHCGYIGLPPLDWANEGTVERCPICGCEEFFHQKDFHQRLAAGIGIAGIVFGFVTRFLSIPVAGIAILALYASSPQILVCYLCRARIRGHRPSPRHRRYDRRVEERVQRERTRGPGRREKEVR